MDDSSTTEQFQDDTQKEILRQQKYFKCPVPSARRDEQENANSLKFFLLSKFGKRYI